MTEKQFETILSALADKLKEKDETSALQKWQIKKLEKALEEAENNGKDTPTETEIR